MSDSPYQEDGCDRECAAANHCRIGGCQCSQCGEYYCIDMMTPFGICENCAAQLDGEDAE